MVFAKCLFTRFSAHWVVAKGLETEFRRNGTARRVICACSGNLRLRAWMPQQAAGRRRLTRPATEMRYSRTPRRASGWRTLPVPAAPLPLKLASKETGIYSARFTERRSTASQPMKCAERQTKDLTEDAQAPCSHSVRNFRMSHQVQEPNVMMPTARGLKVGVPFARGSYLMEIASRFIKTCLKRADQPRC